MKEYEKCEMCGRPIKSVSSSLATFQVCSQECLDELTALIVPGTSPIQNVYSEEPIED